MAPLCKTWCNYTQLLELSFSSPHPLLFSFIYPIPPPSPLYSLLSVSLYSSEKILCRRFYCRKPTYPFFSLSLSLSLPTFSPSFYSSVSNSSGFFPPPPPLHLGDLPEERPRRSEVESSSVLIASMRSF